MFIRSSRTNDNELKKSDKRRLQLISTRFKAHGFQDVQSINRRRRLKDIHSRSDTNRTGAEGLSFY